jgi:hypothetical protein
VNKAAYVVGVVDALNAMARRMSNVAPPFAPESIPRERAEAVRRWREGLVGQVRATAVSEIEALTPPENLGDFHTSLLRCIEEPDDERGQSPSWHGAPRTDGWPRVMMRLALLCQEEGVAFPTAGMPRGELTEPDPERASPGGWRAKVRRELEDRGDPDPDEAIQQIEELRDQQGS